MMKLSIKKGLLAWVNFVSFVMFREAFSAALFTIWYYAGLQDLSHLIQSERTIPWIKAFSLTVTAYFDVL